METQEIQSNFKEIRELFKETGERFKETEQRFRDADKRLKQTEKMVGRLGNRTSTSDQSAKRTKWSWPIFEWSTRATTRRAALIIACLSAASSR